MTQQWSKSHGDAAGEEGLPSRREGRPVLLGAHRDKSPRTTGDDWSAVTARSNLKTASPSP